MINDTLENVNEAEDALDDANTGSQIENIKEKNAKRLESVENFRREIEEEKSFLKNVKHPLKSGWLLY